MRNYGGVTGVLGQLYRLKRFRESADLVELDENRVSDPVFNTLAEDPGVGDEDIVAHHLDRAAQPVGEGFPAGPVVLGQPVLDGDDRVALDQPSSRPIICPELRRLFSDFRTYLPS